MRRTMTILFRFTLTLAVGIVLWLLGSEAQAQPGCKSFEAIGQASLPSSTPLGLTFDVWGGPLYAMLGGEFLGVSAVFSGNDGEETFRSHVGQGRGGSYTVGVNCNPGLFYSCTDTFTYEVPNAVFPSPPGQAGLLFYIGNTAKIVAGTGRFEGASGNLNVRGPAIVWPDSNPFGVSGRWDPEISGDICGIQ
jgi:hypothetical protein